MLLRVDDLAVAYDDVPALSGIRLEVEEGEFVSLVGPNCAGKTTLLNALSGMVRPFRGRVWFQGRDITGAPPHAVVRLGLVQVPECRELFPDMTVRENLIAGTLFGRARRAREGRMERVLDVFPALRDKLDAPCRTLSGGQQQMVAILRALMCEPRLLMLDEPSFGLSPLLVRELFGVIRSLHQTGLTVLLVEQNVKQSLSISDTAYVLEGGRVTAHGRAADLLADEETVRAYLGV